MQLSDLKQGESALLVRVKGKGAFRRKVMEMGFVAGETVSVVRKAPLNDPVEYSVKGSHVILRNHDAKLIEVVRKGAEIDETGDYGLFYTWEQSTANGDAAGVIHVALIGNPTSGKTALFNRISGMKEKVGNYSGVTIEPKTAQIKHRGYQLLITDLPGAYSLRSDAPGSRVIRDFLFEHCPDVVINVADASSLERNLYLTTEVIDLDVKAVLALNMYDIFEKSGDHFDHHNFGKMTGMPVVPVSATRGRGIEELMDTLVNVFENREESLRHVHINYGEVIENSLRHIQKKIRSEGNEGFNNMISSRFLAIKLLEGDKIAAARIEEYCANYDEILKTAKKEAEKVESSYHVHCESIITDSKYGFIKGALKETMRLSKEKIRKTDEAIDGILTHRIFGLPIFLGLMWLMFTATFRLGSYPMEWIESGVAWISELISSAMPSGVLKDLLIDGVISGVGGVIIFLPNILLLYFFIGLMEDTGYMSRAVFIMDRIMHRMGLHGKSFIPLVMGFGCNVPAILATRMLENRKDRIVTILINPFMSCNARLPVYILLIGTFFQEWQGLVFFGIYTLGILVAVITALILKKTLFRSDEHPFVMELPPYRMPAHKIILGQMWERTQQYLKKIGGVILIASVIFWVLSYFPRVKTFSRDYAAEEARVEAAFASDLSAMKAAGITDTLAVIQQRDSLLHRLGIEQSGEQMEQSFIGRVGRFIEPVIRPLGFDWRIGISLLSGIPAKEIIISTMSVLYRVDDESDLQHATLREKILAQTHTSGVLNGEPVFNPAVALALMVFVLLYIPCVGTVIAMSRETGSWKWGLFSIVYSLALAWLLSFAVYRLGLMFF